MDFVAVVDQAIALLRQRGRLTYRTLQLQFQLDAEHLAALTDELIKGQQLAADEDGVVLVWIGDAAVPPAPSVAAVPTPAPLTYTPPYLAEKILTSKSAMEGERKQVTVLFADLKGSTELIRDLDPEDAQRLLDPALQCMMAAVHRYEGTVNQVLGDGIMALFGAPVAHEDHAARACYAALAMQAAMRCYAEEVRQSHGLELPPASAEAFLATLLGDDPSLAPLTPLLIARTEGNPFFLEESVRTLVETGVLVGEPGAYHLVQALPTIQMPATVHAVLAARIDRLPPEEKRLLQTAAVIGTEVPLPLLHAIAEVPEAALQHGLAHLQAAEFLYETRLYPDPEYTFKHALTHEVAYGSLLQERRRVLHARIVAVLGALVGDRVSEQVERLAAHALRGEVWDKALVYCRQAGEKTMARSVHREAVGYFEQALGALPHLPETRATREQAVDLRLALRSALQPSGDLGRILAHLREAEALAAALDDPRRLGQVSRFLSRHFSLIGAHEQAITAAQRALALATASSDMILYALAHQYLGIAYETQGDYGQAIDCFGQTVASLDGTQRYALLGQAILPAVFSRTWLTQCHAERGAFAEGQAVGEEGLRIAEAVTHPASRMYAYYGIGLLALRQGDIPRALPLLERAMGSCQEADRPGIFPAVAAALGVAYMLGRRIADGLPLLTQVLEQVSTMDIVGVQALYGLALGEAPLLAGHLEKVHALTERTLALARERQERGHEAYALHLLGAITAQREILESDQAGEYYRQALALAEKLGMRPLQAHCHRGLGTLYATTGQREQACTELSAAIAMYQSMDMTFWLPQTETALAQMEAR